MPKHPKVSVFIASYNHARFLPECLDSILAQTYQDFEIVIVNDGSTDNSHEILMDYQRRFPEKIHYHWHPGFANKGVTATSNFAISQTKGEYLAWTGSDDVWFPEKLELQTEQLDHDPHLGMVYSYADFIDGEGRILPERAGTDITSDPNPVGQMLRFCHPPAMTVVIRRQCLEDIGVFDETLQVVDDWDLWIRLFSHWKVGFINRSLAKYRIHGNNLSKGIDPKVDLNRILTLYQHLEQKLYDIGGDLLKDRNLAILDLQLAFHLFSADEVEEAIARLHSAFQKDPSLCEDVTFFDNWLNQWKPDFYTTENSHFGMWVIAHLPPVVSPVFRNRLFELQLHNPETNAFFVQRGILWGKERSEPVDMARIFYDSLDELPIPHSWKIDVMKEVYPALLFESYKTGNLSKTRYYWRKTIQLDRTWLMNRGILTIGLKSLFGS